MDRGSISSRIEALRAECAALGSELVEHGRSLDSMEAFEVAGELQGLVNAAEGAQAVVAGLAARVETRLSGSGPVERTHPVGFVDGMAPSMLAMEACLTEGLAGRKVRLGAELSARFPRVRDLLVAGAVPAAACHKVLDVTAGLDADACARVDADLAPRLPSLDPARVTSETRRVATRVAADQLAAHVASTRRGRTVEVRAGDDGLTEWWALVPAATSAAAWSAVEALAAGYRDLDPGLTVGQARADAFGDLLLRDVQVSAQVTLGVPVVTGAPDGATTPTVREASSVEDTVVDHETGEVTRIADLAAASRDEMSSIELHADDETGGAVFGRPMASWRDGVAVSGTQLPGLGWVEPATLAGLLRTLPVDVARVVLDADTGTQVDHVTAAYTPPRAVREFVTARDDRCRMWGCTARVDRCDLDHVRPWPDGATTPENLVPLCRRHHRLKQLGRWRPRLDPDGTLTWHGPHGATRTTEPLHRVGT